MNSRNKKLLLILVVLMLFVSIGKETYALFTSEVSSIVQNFGTGTLKLSYSNTSVNLDNAYPLTDQEGMALNENTITITNVGTLAYKFNVILEPTNNSTLDSSLIKVSMDGENPAILSSDSNIIIRDVILNPGSSRTFTIKLWIPNTVSSSDILGKKFNANLTSSGIAVKDVEDSDGTVLIGNTILYDYIKDNADTTTQIDFNQTSEESSTNGIYTTTDTDSGNPVYYYRGVVDNNVLFANFCWKIIRTTETGGVKLIYNGVQKETINPPIEESSYTNVTNDATYPYTFDSTNKTWESTNRKRGTTGTITFSVDTAGDYVLSYVMSYDEEEVEEESLPKALFYKNGNKLEEHSEIGEGTISLTGLTTSDVIKVEYKLESKVPGSRVVFSIGKAVGNLIKLCNNTRADSTIGNYQFNSSSNSPAYAGYMYNTIYTSTSKKMSNQTGTIIFGNDIDYDASTNQYTLKDTYTLTDVSNWSSERGTMASKYHYTCFTSSDTCEKVNYVYATSSVLSYYFELSGGKNHLDILKEMLDNSTNTNDSEIKTTIDTWYKNNMTSYTSQLEDTVFCNDRSYDVSKTGWNKDYSNIGSELYFNSYQRLGGNYKPTLVCTNTNDKFTVDASNGNGDLTYPVGLITADEIAYAGGVYGLLNKNSSYYLYNNSYQWTFSPCGFGGDVALGFHLDSGGDLYDAGVDNGGGVRPVVSLKPGIAIVGGTGTATDPFVVN